MPSLPKRPCTYPCCGVLVASGRCEKHRVQQQQKQQLERGTTAERGYGAVHKRLRVQCFERDEWRCVDCGWEPELVRIFREADMGIPPTDRVLEELRQSFGRNERHLHADHEIPIYRRPELAEDLGNYRTRCDSCHSRKTDREDRGFGNA